MYPECKEGREGDVGVGTYHFHCTALDGPVSLFNLFLGIGGFGVGLQDVAFPSHTDVALQVPLRASPDVSRVCEQGPLVTELMTCKSIPRAQRSCSTDGPGSSSQFSPTPKASYALLSGELSRAKSNSPATSPPPPFPLLLRFLLSSPSFSPSSPDTWAALGLVEIA